MAQRIKGQETSLFIMNNGVEVAALHDVRNFTMTPSFDKLEEKYLGETSNRFDEIFKGVNFEFEVHLESGGFTDFVNAVKDRAQRRTAGTIINVSTILNFPNGDRKKVILRDCYFADMPFNVASRTDYASLKFSGSASDFEAI